jgi:signal transduction histidine kinase
MRSIRQSLTVYLFALLAVTLAVVWFVIDQVTARTLAARAEASGERLRAQYEQRCRDELARVDQELLGQAKNLGNVIMRAQNEERFNLEMVKYRASVGTVQLAFGPVPLAGGPLAQAAWSASGNFVAFDRPSWRPLPNPIAGDLFRTYFGNLPLPEDDILHFEDHAAGNDYIQVNTVAGRQWESRSLGGKKFPFDPRELDAKPSIHARAVEGASLIDWSIGDATLGSNQEAVRRVVYKVPHWNPQPGRRGPPPPGRRDGRDDRPPPGRSLLGSYVTSGVPQPSPNQPTEPLPRLYIQCARPQAVIDAPLARFAAERDTELAELAAEITEARIKLRFDLTTIALVAFLALAVGAPLLVGRGLRPVGRLSEAVSRVSEKDFKLTHDGNDLSVELAPIHARLTQTLDLLRRAFSREKQAVADISHELRTPIAALMATIDVALRKPRTPDQYREALEECRMISKQLGQLVERIMTLASLDAGNDRLLVSRTDAGELASGCVAVIRPLAAANGVAVEVRAEDGLDVETDAGKLREVLMNLLHNAIEYNKPDGSIHLGVKRAGGNVEFEVRDTGIGMTPEVREKIFERFYRADASRHATGVHAGLGLAIVKEYVARLNGTIGVESEPGVGSTFRVTVPAPTAPPGEPGESRPFDVPVTAGA